MLAIAYRPPHVAREEEMADEVFDDAGRLVAPLLMEVSAVADAAAAGDRS